MADAAANLRTVAIELLEAEYVWLEDRARQQGGTPEEVLVGLVREARTRRLQRDEARERLLEYLGDAADVDPAEEATLLREIRGTD